MRCKSEVSTQRTGVILYLWTVYVTKARALNVKNMRGRKADRVVL